MTIPMNASRELDLTTFNPEAPPPAETSEAVAERARRMCRDGHGLRDIASALRVHPEQVRRWLAALGDGEAAVVHARAWRPRS